MGCACSLCDLVVVALDIFATAQMAGLNTAASTNKCEVSPPVDHAGVVGSGLERDELGDTSAIGSQ